MIKFPKNWNNREMANQNGAKLTNTGEKNEFCHPAIAEVVHQFFRF